MVWPHFSGPPFLQTLHTRDCYFELYKSSTGNMPLALKKCCIWTEFGEQIAISKYNYKNKIHTSKLNLRAFPCMTFFFANCVVHRKIVIVQ